MKKFVIAVCLMVFVSIAAPSQEEPKSEKKEMTAEMFALYQKGDLEAASKLGEKLVKMEKASGDETSYVNALVNLARIRRDYYIGIRELIANGKFRPSEVKSARAKASQNGDDAEDLFREALAINEKNNRAQTAQTADIKRDLAWLLANRSYSGKQTVPQARARIDEAEKFILEAIATGEATRGKDADETLAAVLDAGDFYYNYSNFEKALPFYERFIQTDAARHGATHPELVKALRPLASIMNATFQDAEAGAMLKRIETITKKSEPAPKGDLSLHLRSKDSVAFSAPLIIDANERWQAIRTFDNAGVATGNFIRQMPNMIAVRVNVEVDETGKVTRAVAQTGDDKLKAEAEATVAKWSVRPFIYNGASKRLRGVLVFRKTK